MLQPVEQPLDTISVPVVSEVKGGRVFAVGPWRDDVHDPVDQQLFAQSVAVIALVCEKQPRLAEAAARAIEEQRTDLEGLRHAFDTNRDNVLDARDARWTENASIRLGRYYLIFAGANAIAIVTVLTTVLSYEFWIGPISGLVITGLNFGVWFAPAVFVASRFVSELGRVPSEVERSQLARASLLLSLLVSFISVILLLCGALVSVIGLASISVYGHAIVDVWNIIFALTFVEDPVFWVFFVFAIALLFLVLLHAYRFAYGRLARQFLQQNKHN